MEDIKPPGFGYSRSTTELIDTFQSIRGVKDYSEYLGFTNEKEFLSFIPRDSLLLDLGSGRGQLAKELFIKRPDITTVSYNPALSKKEFRKLQKKKFLEFRTKKDWLEDNPWGIPALSITDVTNAQLAHDRFGVSGINPNLPFKDESFDCVFDSMASVFYSSNASTDEKMLEIFRVAKHGGVIAVGPFMSGNSLKKSTASLPVGMFTYEPKTVTRGNDIEWVLHLTKK